jgi:tetratricopeptide (TPR) repeat protein
LLLGCTPKTGEQTQGTTPIPPKPPTDSGPCATFKDSKAGEAALDAHVIYRDFIKREQYKEAIPYWRQAFKAAPAADGQRTTHFDDGVRIYDYLLSQQKTEAKKQIYLDSILYMYDRLFECYPEGQYVEGKKAFDLYYNYKDLTDNRTIFDLFTTVIDREGLETPAFVINPFTALLTEMFFAREIDTTTAVRYTMQVLAITDKHADLIENAPCDMSLKYTEDASGNCVSTDQNGVQAAAASACCELAEDIAEGWPIVVGYAPQRLVEFETVVGFYPCSYFKEKYFDPIDLDALDCDDFKLTTQQLRRGKCADDDPAIQAMIAEYQERCITSPGPTECWKLLEDGRYQRAIDCFIEYIKTLQDPAKRARYNLYIAKIYYGNLRNFPRSREFARLALRDQPNMGEAYMLIGKLYASSGPLCGPGRGWDSQIVTWPAIDMFEKAKSVDSGVANEANKLIRDYSKYMPSVEDIFQRQLAEGQSFQVGCWIQETTMIRAAR